MNCLSCGTRLAPGAQFCEVCGTAVAGAVGSTATPTPTRAGSSYQGAVPGQSGPSDVSSPWGPGGIAGDEPTTLSGHVGRYPTGSPPMRTPASADPPPKSRSGWKWFGIGGGAALVIALVAGLAFMFLGEASSSKSSTVADPSADTTAPAVESTPDTVVATAISGVWPTPATWASDKCETRQYDAVTSLETSRSQVVICTDDPSGANDASYYYWGRTTGLDWSPLLDADYNEAAQEFVATNAGNPPTTYTVSPTTLRIDTGDDSQTEYASNAKPHGNVSDDDLLAQLVNLMEASSNGRGAVQGLANGTYNGNVCTSSADARSSIRTIIENRSQMLDAAKRLVADAGTGTIAPAAHDFANAMQSSLDFDDEFSTYIDQYWAPYADAGCPGSKPLTFNDAMPAGLQAGENATAAKQALVQKVNALAAGTSLRSDWKFTDV